MRPCKMNDIISYHIIQSYCMLCLLTCYQYQTVVMPRESIPLENIVCLHVGGGPWGLLRHMSLAWALCKKDVRIMSTSSHTRIRFLPRVSNTNFHHAIIIGINANIDISIIIRVTFIQSLKLLKERFSNSGLKSAHTILSVMELSINSRSLLLKGVALPRFIAANLLIYVSQISNNWQKDGCLG